MNQKDFLTEAVEIIGDIRGKHFDAVECVIILGLAHSIAVIEMGVDKARSDLLDDFASRGKPA